jgi:hypothetical protein
MDEVRPGLTQQRGKFSSRIGCPNGGRQQSKLSKAVVLVDFKVAPTIGHDFMAGTLEQAAFEFENDVFPPGLLVLIMN